MDLALLQQHLIANIEALQREGYVDHYMKMCYGLKETSGITFFLELIVTFLTDAATVIDDMTATVEHPILDYDKMQELAIKLKGSSACIGACRISAGCTQLLQEIRRRSRRDCKLVVEMMIIERSTLEIKLETIMQLEREIVDRQLQ
ncbi:PREDICTED: histidine-containing phosphotransfer protein 2-like [Ipomoea nil]|uniref:histidine-containing phosphotransfer protein 2-like n=1 Tax=Ipomoea nil TaxID=35883 RepID=UPI000900C290|nr:PREDICTED: histidine-containing phosphotransfer protein 2-like [Ipomoea nil]